jgi:mRNA interferase RelE/StbE
MNHYIIEFRTAARKALRRIVEHDRTRILKAIERLADDPYLHGREKLSGEEGLWRIRVGDYRVIYTVVQNRLVVVVVTIGHRREVYR